MATAQKAGGGSSGSKQAILGVIVVGCVAVAGYLLWGYFSAPSGTPGTVEVPKTAEAAKTAEQPPPPTPGGHRRPSDAK